jgi:hypothetical protein
MMTVRKELDAAVSHETMAAMFWRVFEHQQAGRKGGLVQALIPPPGLISGVVLRIGVERVIVPTTGAVKYPHAFTVGVYLSGHADPHRSQKLNVCRPVLSGEEYTHGSLVLSPPHNETSKKKAASISEEQAGGL